MEEVPMDRIPTFTWCVAERCPGGVDAVARALAARLRDDPVVAAARGRLEVRAAVEGFPVVGSRRVHPARLFFARWRAPARVTLEVHPWSEDSTERLLRPARTVPWPADRYFTAALDVLATLAAVVGPTRPALGVEPTPEVRRAS